jgi:hypothetical protein
MNYIYETPWWLPTGVALLGLILFITGNNRLEKKLRLSGVIVMALAILLAVVSFVLDSEREKVIKRTRELVNFIEARDWNKLATYLHPNVTVAVFSGRQNVVDATRSGTESADIKQIRITSLDATEQPDEIISTTLRVYATMANSNNLTDWTIEWEKTDDVWLARNIIPIGGPGISAGTLEGYIRAHGK